MNLENYIQQLLYNFDCVIIPNFGGIVAQPVSASILSTQHIFYAPKRQLAFNKNLDKSDGLLINHISTAKNISFNEAATWVENVVKNWKNELQENGKLNIAEIGRFIFDKEQNIQFEAASFVNYLPDAYGCASFNTNPIVKDLKQKQPKKQPKFIEVKKEKIARNFNFKKLVPYGLALPLLVSIIYFSTQKNIVENVNIVYSNLNPFNAESTVPAYSERIPVVLPTLTVPQKMELPITEETATETNEVATTLLKATPAEIIEQKNTNTIHLIVGAFATEQNANDLISELKNKGFNAYLQGKNSSGLFRVSCNKFSNKHEALSAKATIKETGLDAWVLEE